MSKPAIFRKIIEASSAEMFTFRIFREPLAILVVNSAFAW